MNLLQSLSPDGRQLAKAEKLAKKIEALSGEYKALSDAELQAKTSQFRQRLSQGESLDELLPGSLRHRARSGGTGDRRTAVSRPADGRCPASSRRYRRDENRRREDADLNSACLPQRPGRPRRARRDRQPLSGPPRRPVDGTNLSVSGSERRLQRPHSDFSAEACGVCLCTSPIRPTPSWASITCVTTWS